MLHIELSPDYPYLEDDSLSKRYVEACIKKAVEAFKLMEFSHNILLVYEDRGFAYLCQKKNIL